VIGFSFTGNGPNKGIIFINLKDAKDRKGVEHSAAYIVDSLRAPLSQISDVQAFPFLPPAINGIGNFGGFTFEVLDEGGHSLQELYDTPRMWSEPETNDTT
jgi:HAE1 family hydrophobic/amphiphilic exporter-1